MKNQHFIKRNGKIKYILTKYEAWFDFFLDLFVSRYKCPTEVTSPSTLKSTVVKHGLLINKVKKKLNQVSYLANIHLIFSPRVTSSQNFSCECNETNEHCQ